MFVTLQKSSHGFRELIVTLQNSSHGFRELIVTLQNSSRGFRELIVTLQYVSKGFSIISKNNRYFQMNNQTQERTSDIFIARINNGTLTWLS